MPYPRFTKAIIHYFMSQHKSISKREGSPYHSVADDGLLDRLKFVSKGNKYQLYGKPNPNALITDDIKKSKAYKMFFKYSIGLIPPKKSRGEPAKVTQETKELAAPKKTISSSKKKITKRNKHKGIEMLSDTAQFEIDTLKAQKESRRESRLQHHPGGLSEGTGSKPGVPDELT
ncbi:hypothetical protein Tco_1187032, partial [Tanacetum coccineum]